jgi:lysophospholipase L1-like esterase
MTPLLISSTHQRLFKELIILTTVSLIFIGGPLMVIPFRKLKGKGMNGGAWRASYYERHLPVPAWGPREGYWGDLMPKLAQDTHVGWIDQNIHMPDHVEVDEHGFQWVPDAPHRGPRILILGGSVAWGTYSSNIRRAYFSQMAYHLSHEGHPVEVVVLAAGAWQSTNELNALRYRGLALHPDYVLFLDGMNDLTVEGPRPLPERLHTYFETMRQARDLALAHHVHVIFAPQPFLPAKPVKTGMERIILDNAYPEWETLIDYYNRLRLGVRAMAIPGKADVIDCAGAFNPYRRTVFSDLWHFSDIGNARLGEYLAHRLEPILSMNVPPAPAGQSS